MDFKPMKKDRKPDSEGLFGWESPRLRAALVAAKKALAPKKAEGLTKTNYRTTGDVDMILKDWKPATYSMGTGEPLPNVVIVNCSYEPESLQ